jgi:hypothetical protein
MKIITTNLTKFALATFFLTLVFRFALSYGIDNKSWLIIIFASAMIAITMYIAGQYWGKKDHEQLPIYNLRFRFHFCSFLIHSIISELWFVLKLNAKNESVLIVHTYCATWLIVIIGHYFGYVRTRKNAIKNLDKEDLFE